MRDALLWMRPYYREERPWTWPQITPFHRGNATFLTHIAARATGEACFAEVSHTLSNRPCVCLLGAKGPHSNAIPLTPA